jgi:hypothetical protein
VVEAKMLGVKALVVDIDKSVLWPSWDEYGLFNKVPMEKLKGVLSDMLRGVYTFPVDNSARMDFISRFRYRHDDMASYRIAGVLKDLYEAK